MTHQDIDGLLRRAADARQVAGVVAKVADGRGVTYQGAFGRRGLPDGAPMTLDTVFWIASMTKAITGVAAMQLVEQGKLSLDAPIGALLPKLAAPTVLEGFDAAGQPNLRPAKRPITLKHLLTHTSGFCYNTWNADLARYMQLTGFPAPSSGLRASLEAPLLFDPGERWEYGIGIDWAGLAVEAASGKPLDVYFKEHIFAPLGMADSGFVPGAAQLARKAAVHARQADGSLQPIEFSTPKAPEFFGGGGGLYSTAGDYLRFLRMFLGNGSLEGTRLLRPETVAQMARNHIGDIDVGWLRSTMPDRSLDANFFPEQPQKWGLTFLINTRRTAQGRSPGSLAWAGLGNTYFWLDLERKLAGVILMQVLPFVDGPCLELCRGFEAAVHRGAA